MSGVDIGPSYMPMEIGKYILYDVDSTYWDDMKMAVIPRICQVRYNIDDTFRDAAGRLSYRISVLVRDQPSDPFKPNDVIYVTPTDNTVEVTQQNRTFIKLVSPVTEGTSWNGNAMITKGDLDNAEFDSDKWSYKYVEVGKGFEPSSIYFKRTVTVDQIDDKLNDPEVDSTAYAYKNYSKEVYAYKVGMIYKERVYWVFQPKVGSSGGSGFPKGYGVRMKAVDHNF